MQANMTKSLTATLLAAGVLVPEQTKASVIIPLGDPGFEDFVVPAASGYAYADLYRPTSAWVDDLDHFSVPYVQDTNPSNWLYNAAYAEEGPNGQQRASPRTGNQAMHGLFHYSAQETSAVFEANMTYTFSAWAQGDTDATLTSSEVFLYLFDGTIPFSDANSLAAQGFSPQAGDFINRPVGVTAEQSQGLWEQISISHTVLPGAPEIGHPIGVGFWVADDGALDDASLSSTLVPAPGMAWCLGIGALLMSRRRRR
jgi:hypothetical protein